MSGFFLKKKKEYSILGHHHTIEFGLSGRLDFLYGVLIEYKGSICSHSLHFLCELNYINDGVVRINQRQVYLNDKLPDLMLETLADDIRKQLYPVEFVLGNYGSLLGIVNYEKYKQRWSSSREFLETRYKGEVVYALLEKVASSIGNHRSCLYKFKENFYLQLMFIPLYDLVFNSDYKRTSQLSFKLYSHLPEFVYHVNFEVGKQKTSTDKVFIVMKGVLLQQSYYEYYKISDSEFVFYLKLNIEDKTLFSIEAEVNSLISGSQEQIKFSSYLQD